MKDKIYYGSMFSCNGIIIACLIFELDPDIFFKSILLGWAGFMLGYGLVEIFRSSNER